MQHLLKLLTFMHKHMKLYYSLLVIAICPGLISCTNNVDIRNGKILFEINKGLETKVSPEMQSVKPFMNNFSASEYLVCSTFDAKLFVRKSSSTSSISDLKGTGKRTSVKGLFKPGWKYPRKDTGSNCL